MKRWTLVLTLSIAGCGGPYRLAETGERENLGLFTVEPQLAWNINEGPRGQDWTVDGYWLHQLTFLQGVKDGHPLFPGLEQRENPPLFRKNMSTPELGEFIVASLAMTGAKKIVPSPMQPFPFGSLTGFRFELQYLDATELEVLSIVVGVVHEGRLWVIIYRAAKELYFPKYKEPVEKLLGSIRLSK